MHSRRRLSISSFFTLGALALLTVFVLFFAASFSSIQKIGTLSHSLREDTLPEILETHRTFTHIESLRRIAETAYLADDPQVRRSARINAQALAAESVFLHNEELYQGTLQISKMISEMAKRRDAAHADDQRLTVLAFEFSQSLAALSARLPDSSSEEKVLALYRQTSVPLSGTLAATSLTAKILNPMQAKDARLMEEIQKICRAQAALYLPLEAVCERQDALYTDYAQVQRDLLDDMEAARGQWEVIDDELREMRDNLSTEAENVGTEALRHIEQSADSSFFTLCFFAVGAAASLALPAYLLRRHLITPLHWTARKLLEIQRGDLQATPPAHMRIQEIADIAELLDRFSHHLAELYARASQLEEDAADKQDMEEVMRAVFRASLDGYCIWSLEGIHFASPGILQLFEVDSMEEILPARSLLSLPSHEVLQERYDEVMQTGFARYLEEFTSRSGSPRPVESTNIPLRYKGKPCILAYFRDLRPQREVEGELRASKERAEEAARAKSDFLARMSHEIRTPMNGVLGLTHLALKESPAPEQKNYLEKIQASARILLGVINDILDFSKIESGKFTLEQREFSLAAMLRTVTDLFGPQAEQKRLSFMFECDPALPEQVRGDELRLSQILLNLCGNAVKFTEKGGIALRIRVVKETPETVFTEFSVADTGLGMTREQLAGLFQPFTQADTSTTRRFGGTGLGLVISKLLIETMGGEIKVQSTLGEGSDFRFTIPLPKAENLLEQGAPEATALPPRMDGLRLLLVEDNPINQEIAAAMLASLGIEATVAGNGEEALAVLKDRDMDGILMDIQMPVMDGLTAARHIRENGREAVRSIPILAMTAHVLQEDRDKSIAVGMNDHLTKPIDVAELHAKLRQWFPAFEKKAD